nr:DinB family protein [Actinomycetales bacterium]
MAFDLVHEIHEQLDWHWRTQARPRLDGLIDDEYFWEPTPGSWSVRPHDAAAPSTATMRLGSGWLMDFTHAEPAPPPVTTIAWRMAHLIVGVFGPRAESHFGAPPADYQTWKFAPTAEGALAQLDETYADWMAGVRGLTPEALGKAVGPAEGPWFDTPMIGLVLHISREGIHHMAEIALLRDLWAHREH